MAGHFNSLVPNTDPSPPSVEQPAIRQPSLALTAVAAIVLSAMVLIGMFWPSSSLEVKFLLWIGESLGTSLDDIMHAMDVVGDVGTMSIALLVLAVLVSFRRGFRPAAAVLVTGVAALLVNVGLKVLVARPRPGLWVAEVDSSYSLPSGHALLFAVFVLLAYELWPWERWRRPLAIVGFLLVGLMGLSRLYLGEHYFSDVVASYSVAILAWVGYRKMTSRSSLSSRQVVERG